MKNKGRIAITAIAIMALAVFASSCQDQKKVIETLEQYITENESEQGFIQNVVGENPDASVTVKENTLEIKYTVQDEGFTAETLDAALAEMTDTFSEIIDGLEKQTGLEGINIQVYYVKPNGETITGKLFK